MSDDSLPLGSPYLSLPSDVIDTLRRSYKERDDTNCNLFTGFDFDRPQANGKKMGPNDRSFKDVLDAIGSADLEVVKRNYIMAQSKLPHFWPQVRSIRKTWGGSSEGFQFNCYDRGALDRMLQTSAQFCADFALFQADHQEDGPTQCYRQLMTSMGPGLHVCILAQGSEDSAGGPHGIHIDFHQIATSTMAGGKCFYSYILDHMVDVGPHLLLDLIIPKLMKVLKRQPISWGTPEAKSNLMRLLQVELGGVAAVIRSVPYAESAVNDVVNKVVDIVSGLMDAMTKGGTNPSPCGKGVNAP